MQNGFEIEKLGAATHPSPLPGSFTVADDAGVLVDATLQDGELRRDVGVLEKAGPRAHLFFDPAKSRAAIVTCGGLCPGLNDVIRAVTMVLWYRYGVRNILGLRYGYEGLSRAFGHEPMVLTPDVVKEIHKDGGTILGSSRGPQEASAMVDLLVDQQIDMLFVIGGDGTQRGGLEITHELGSRNLPISVIGVPKTIDNDISYTDRTFGFETAVAMSQAPIEAAHMEATGARNGVSLVKLMGRESGFVAAYASLASSDVNLVLVPEIPFQLERVVAWLQDRLERKSHAVIVAAEGAGQDLVAAEGADASGNRALGDIGLVLKQEISMFIKTTFGSGKVRYIDPSYTIRSASATADDSVLCFQLAENAVHAAMSGRTGMVVSLWNSHFVHVPMARAVERRKRIDPHGALWQSVLDNTGQPADLG